MSNLVENFAVYTLSLLTSFVKIILKPVDLVITALIPSFDSIVGNINNLLSYLYNIFVYIVEWLHLPSQAISLLIAYIIFRITLFFTMLTVRLVIKWYKVIKH